MEWVCEMLKEQASIEGYPLSRNLLRGYGIGHCCNWMDNEKMFG